MSDLQQLWRLSWIGELGRHLADELTPLLPDDRELVAGPRELDVMIRRADAPLRLATSYLLPVPNEHALLGAVAAGRILSDVQDEIAIHLARAWPVGDSGAALTATATESPEGIALAFVSTTGDEEIRLAPFRPPPGLDEARVAG